MPSFHSNIFHGLLYIFDFKGFMMIIKADINI